MGGSIFGGAISIWVGPTLLASCRSSSFFFCSELGTAINDISAQNINVQIIRSQFINSSALTEVVSPRTMS